MAEVIVKKNIAKELKRIIQENDALLRELSKH